MPGKTDKTHRIRVRVIDGKPREWNKLKGEIGAHLDVIDAKGKVEFIICGVNEKQIEQVRPKLAGAGLEEIPGGDTADVAQPLIAQPPRQGGVQQRGSWQQSSSSPQASGHQPQSRAASATTSNAPDLRKKPYGFVAIPTDLASAPPVWHDGTSSAGRFSGEIRFELETLTPMLVGWERGQAGDAESDWPVPTSFDGVGHLVANKSVLCPLRAPWGNRPVLIPGDSLKGLLRHELGALLGAPMERVAERSYSYRPNALFPNQPNPKLVARIARVAANGVETRELGEHQVRVPTRLELFPANLEYNKKAKKFDFRFDQNGGLPYRGGQGAGQDLNSKRKVHTSLKILRESQMERADVPQEAQEGYLGTLRHLLDLGHGHFSDRHPDVPNTVTGDAAQDRILDAAKLEVFQPGDLIWVEWDTEKKSIVSLGWHYYYRWAYVDSIRKKGGKLERHGLFPLDGERAQDGEGAPKGVSPVRRLFGYTGDNDGSAGIGKDDHAQLMGRVSINAGLEVVGATETDEQRFLRSTYLKELGMPRPSAVEHYLQQPHHPKARPADKATLVTYGDAAGCDEPGELAGRKFYLDRKDAYSGAPWKDDSEANRANDRSTLALEASKSNRKFRFTARFRDLDDSELAAILVAFCPHQFRAVLGGTHADGYCSKLGYARPLGWGSVRIDAKELLLLDGVGGTPTLKPEADLDTWLRKNHQKTSSQEEWLAVHRHKHPFAEDYPRPPQPDRNGDRHIYAFHSQLRADHSRDRRYRNRGAQ